MGLEALVEAAARELALFAAVGFLIGGVDELLIDLAWAARAIRRLFVFRQRPRATVASLPPAAPLRHLLARVGRERGHRTDVAAHAGELW